MATGLTAHGALARLGFLLTIASVAARAEGAAVDFESRVAPLLAQRCLGCHRADRRKGGLSVADEASLLAGGDSGPVVVRGRPEDSLLVELVTPGPDGAAPAMPAVGEPLSSSEVEVLRRWIAAGAPWPADLVLDAYEAESVGWALRPVRRVDPPPPPADAPVGWGEHPVDRFVLPRLRAAGLEPAPEADRATLIRRLSLDLLGLPPTPEEIDAFVLDTSPEAYERLVDRLLASPRRGERWARHWLDIAHYADTHGFERDMRRDNAWRYRDWVVRALNEDLPYERFVLEQIAGDVVSPSDPDAVVATGFLAAGPFDFVGQVETASSTLRVQARADDLDDMVTTVITSTMGLTVNCARCHDHKLDPIDQEDYYRLWAVFAGTRRGDRPVPSAAEEEIERLEAEMRALDRELATLEGRGLDLVDLLLDGDGLGSAEGGRGLDPVSGELAPGQRPFLDGVTPNRFVASPLRYVDGVVVPAGGPVVVSSTGILLRDLPAADGRTWDYVQAGPVLSQRSTTLAGIDYGEAGHRLLGLHANKALTFDLRAVRADHPELSRGRFRAIVGYGGRSADVSAEVLVYVDDRRVVGPLRLGPESSGAPLDVPLGEEDRFLVLVSLDGGNGISHDQVFFGDPRLVPEGAAPLSDEELARHDELRERGARARARLEALRPQAEPAKVYAVVGETPPPVHVLERGDPTARGAEVAPGALSCVSALSPDLASADAGEGERRLALARWIVDPDNPLTGRVIVNRLWHHHFGRGIVSTPSDFGALGGRPSHPQLLDWLAAELSEEGGSLKAIQRLIVTSRAYRQSSAVDDGRARSIDADNRLLWRANPRRLEVEAIRDSVLAVSGALDLRMGGPGFEDFRYRQEYAPVYTFITPDRPELWRRTVYRFVVRTTPNVFLDVLDCPNPAVLTPVRNRTTTALQSLALLNNPFMVQQAELFAQRLRREGGASVEGQVELAFRLALGRSPATEEARAGRALVEAHGALHLCRALLNASEFLYVD